MKYEINIEIEIWSAEVRACIIGHHIIIIEGHAIAIDDRRKSNEDIEIEIETHTNICSM